MPFSIDPGLCRRDGICAAVCPVRIITWSAGELPQMGLDAEKRCIRCGQCMAFCPTAACAAPGLSVRDQLQLRPELFPDPQQVEELIYRRRSIRNFRSKPVPKELLARILDAARFAPSSHNSQPLRWIVVDGPDKVRALAELVVIWLEQLPASYPDLAVRLHAAGLAKAWRGGHDVIMRGAPQLALAVTPKSAWGAVDAAGALAYVELAACSHGVGACWAGYFTIAAAHPLGAPIREALGLNADEAVQGGQMLGYPRFTSFARPSRKAPNISWI